MSDPFPRLRAEWPEVYAQVRSNPDSPFSKAVLDAIRGDGFLSKEALEQIRISRPPRRPPPAFTDWPLCGVYSLAAPNGDEYIGASIDIHSRWGQHFRALRGGHHTNPRLQGGYYAHNGALTPSVLLLCEAEQLNTEEIRFILKRSPAYNVDLYTEQQLARGKPGKPRREDIVAMTRRWPPE